jgi:hypothetical protein
MGSLLKYPAACGGILYLALAARIISRRCCWLKHGKVSQRTADQPSFVTALV